MNTKKLLSAAAAVAVMTSGAMAFDTDSTGGLFKIDTDGSKIYGKYNADPAKIKTADENLTADGPGMLGDALIYPAFFSKNGWSTEFSIINTSNDEAVVAKVVLYSRVDSKELKDFNVYLSANDIFRATIKDGKIISTDGSTVLPSSDSWVKPDNGDHTYTYKDSSTMASDSHPFEVDLPEDSGYIVVYGMIQADKDDANTTVEKEARYHNKHQALWRDYRHLLDKCRNVGGEDDDNGWRSGIQGGIYSINSIYAPNIDLTACNDIVTTSYSKNTHNISFKSPDQVLTGSLSLKGSDSRGTRSMRLKAVPLINFTIDDQALLWTEGEFAAIADRDIEQNASNKAVYSLDLVRNDRLAFRPHKYIYEFGNSADGSVIVTQPHKRTLVQLNGQNANCCWKLVKKNSKGLVTNYGGFTLSTTLYDDDENKYTPSSGGFTVSPATTASADLIAPEVAMFNPIPDVNGYASGYAILPINVPAIVTQMTATEVDGNVETNWIYSAIAD